MKAASQALGGLVAMFAVAILPGCGGSDSGAPVVTTTGDAAEPAPNTPDQPVEPVPVDEEPVLPLWIETGEQLRLEHATGFRVDKNTAELAFTDQNGTVVLQSTPNTRPGPSLGVELNEVLGSDNLPDLISYAPITFTVGAEVNLEWPLGFWVGNILGGIQLGGVFTTQDLIKIESTPSGKRVTFSTNDPGGRVVVADIRPAEFDSVEVSLEVVPDTHVVSVGMAFQAGPDEGYYGFGGRHNAIDQRGNEVINYVQAQNLAAGPLQPVVDLLPGTDETYLFPSGPDAAFYVSASFVSSDGYGFFLDNDELGKWRMASDSDKAWNVSVSSPSMTFLVTAGTEKQATRNISGINGRHRTPPEWALGPVLSRNIQTLGANSDDAASYEAKVRNDIDMIRTLDLPINGYAFEAWDLLPRDVARGFIKELNELGLRTYLYVRNYVGLDLANTEDPKHYNEALEKGYVATTATGQPFLFGTTFLGLGAVIDYTNPEAVAWWNERLREMLDLGADGFMQDFGENVLTGMHFYDGSTGFEMHNAYLNLFHKTTRDFLDQYKAETGRDIFFYTRGGYSGRPGSAAYENSNFPGDENADWSRSSGIKSLTTDMLSRAVAGAWGFNTDIGGYIDIHVPPTTKELFIRWSQWAALSPVFRVHNSVSNGVRMPWSFDDEALELFSQAAQLHLDATPYILSLWEEGQETGLPPTRPLWMEFPEDARARVEDQQWMLGEDVLVAPVVDQGATRRDVYFPAGCWSSPDTGMEYHGPIEQMIPAPLNRLPYFFRCGTKPF